MPAQEFSEVVRARKIGWAPDGDEAFDDGSFVLQIDNSDVVQIIAFRLGEAPTGLMTESIVSVFIVANDFYDLLSHWLRAFEKDRQIRLASEPQ